VIRFLVSRRLPLFPILLAFIGLYAGSPSTNAQEQRVLAPHRPVDPTDPPSKVLQLPATTRSMVGGFWMIDAYRKASISLKNGLETSSIAVRPALYLSNGMRYELDSLTVSPAGISVISINDSLAKLGIAPWGILSGYVEMEYSWAWDPLCVTVTTIDATHSTIFTSGLQPSAVATASLSLEAPRVVNGLNTVDGVWWKATGNVTGFVALSNASVKAVDAKITVVSDSNSPVGDVDVHLSPHGTKVVDLKELVPLPKGATGGLRIEYAGASNAVLITGGLEDDSSGYSANIPLRSFAMPAQSQPVDETYTELGLMTGAADPMLLFPVGTTFTPYSILRNVGDSLVTVTPTFYWMIDGAPRSAHLPSFKLASLSSLSLDLPSLLLSAGLGTFQGSVNLALKAQGPPGSLLLAGGSVDQNNNYVFQVFPRGVQESVAKSISYWSTGNGDDTMVTVWNPADEPQNYTFTLLFDGGHYRVPLHLEARASRMFNISDIIHGQIPDADGEVIPAGVHEGSAKIAGTQADNEHILVAMDASTYNVRKATCSYYCISCDGSVYAYVDTGNPFPFVAGSTSQFYLHENWNTGVGTYTNYATWSSSSTNIATVNATNGSGTGVSGGTTTFTASLTDAVYNSHYCGYNSVSCPALGFVQGTGSENVKPQITAVSPNWGQVGTSVPVTITGKGFGTAGTVSFSGTGITVTYGARNDSSITATFTIAPSTTVGFQNVTVTNSGQASGPANFQVSPAIATPVNFHMVSQSNLNDGSLFFTYAWSSSTGNQADLSACKVGEQVYYPAYPTTPYVWPLPMVQQTANPTVLSYPGTYQGGPDTNGPPNSYASPPYSSSSFTATQRFYWSCTNYNGGATQTLYPDIIIARNIFKDVDGYWKFQIQKSGYLNKVKLPGQ
jgi:hypothetical protein